MLFIDSEEKHLPTPRIDPGSVHASFQSVVGWLADSGLEGYDPYDALASGALAAISQRLHIAGRLAIHGLRVLPIDLRPALGIRPAPDAKALGLLTRAYYLASENGNAVMYRTSAEHCLKLLSSVQVSGFSGACWGHPFPYISSRSLLPADFPTVVSTVYAAQAFLDAYEQIGDAHGLQIGRSACDFVLQDLTRIGTPDRFCFSYYPGIDLPVHNASLLAATLLARVARLTGDAELLEPVQAAVRYTLADQQPDGSWPYDGPESASRKRTFVDGFHTGFMLEGLWDIAADAGLDVAEALSRGLDFYLQHLFEPSGQPRRFVDRLWPLDLRDCAQAIIVLSRMRGFDPRAEEMLDRVVEWTVSHMQAPNGYFYYLRWKWYITPIPYIRFQAWMMLALVRYLQATS